MPTLLINKKIVYRISLWILLIVGVVLLLRLAPILSKPENMPSDDFVPYWTGGRLTLHGDNPYNPQKIEQLQIAAGGVASGTYPISIMLNPPWTISLFLPFSLLDYSPGRLSWLIASIFLIIISSHLLWSIYSGNPKKRWVYLLLVFSFAPVISMLEVGQIACLILLGITGFIYFANKQRNDWLAGAFIAIASIKPQIAFLFWVAALFWIIQQRRWLILVSAAITVLLLTLISMVFNPQIIAQYFSMLQSYQISDWASPTIGAYLRFFLFGTDKFWLQFLPSIFGLLWLVYFWHNRKNSWEWRRELPAILLASIITSPYSWTYDQVILIPAIIQIIVWIGKDWRRLSALLFVICYFILNALDLILHKRLDDFWFIWLAPGLLILFLLIRWQFPAQKVDARLSNQIVG